MNNHPWGTLMRALGVGSMGGAETREFIVAQRPFQTKNLNVAIFVFPLVQIIDLAGHYEVFQQAGAHTYTVGEKLDPIQTAAGLTIIPKYTFETAPKVDVLVLPGGDGVAIQLVNPAAIKWIQSTAKKTIEVLTVCTGSFLAAKAGLLDGLARQPFTGLLMHWRTKPHLPRSSGTKSISTAEKS
jgi:transcriptional regulator GlxA family with amidase domain